MYNNLGFSSIHPAFLSPPPPPPTEVSTAATTPTASPEASLPDPPQLSQEAMPEASLPTSLKSKLLALL